jgi:hypothetical protein
MTILAEPVALGLAVRELKHWTSLYCVKPKSKKLHVKDSKNDMMELGMLVLKCEIRMRGYWGKHTKGNYINLETSPPSHDLKSYIHPGT